MEWRNRPKNDQGTTADWSGEGPDHFIYAAPPEGQPQGLEDLDLEPREESV